MILRPSLDSVALIASPNYRAPIIIIQNIEQLKRLLQALENGIIFPFSLAANLETPKRKVKGVNRKI